MSLRLLNLFTFQIGWLACVLGAGRDRPLLGPAVVAMFLGLYLWLSPSRSRSGRFILTVGLIGATIDTLLGIVGVFTFRAGVFPAWACPPWLVALWLNFASALESSLSWLARRTVLAAALGAVAGPLSYYAGDALGALQLSHHRTVSVMILAILWGTLLPALMRLMEWMVREPEESMHR